MSEKIPNEPAHPAVARLRRAPRCGARTRAGSPCRSPAVRGRRRCRMHGGAAGSGGQPGNRNAWKHGARSARALELRRRVRELLRGARELVEEVG
jgi:hypothetical protein